MDFYDILLAKKLSGGGSTPVEDQLKGLVERTAESLDLSGVTKIGNSAFYNYQGLKSVNMPNVTYIDASAFDSCGNLVITKFPSGLTRINASAFAYCNKFSDIEFPASVATIAGQAFQSCSGLRTITFKGKPTSLNANAFRSCANVTDIYVPWAKGEVSGAPWGATNATIHYNS